MREMDLMLSCKEELLFSRHRESSTRVYTRTLGVHTGEVSEGEDDV